MAKTVISDKVVMHDSNTTLHDKIESLSQSPGGQGGVPITIDNALSSTSTNAIQNKVVSSALSTVQAAIKANQSSIATLQAAINNIGTGGGNNEGFIIPVDPTTTPVEAGAVWFETDNTTP